MLLSAINLSKSIGAKNLFKDVGFGIAEGEKVALVGRNGYGKTTLLKILSGDDHDFTGQISSKKGMTVTLTKQEHIHNTQQSSLEYILDSVPHYYEYKKILHKYEQGFSTNLNRYLEILEKFTELRYFHVEDAILSTLADFHISNELAHMPLAHLSGGQKRYVEMARMMFCQSDLLLVDEPTNHMDYLGKQRFISWLKSLPQAVVVVTHDRDVLRNVHKIMELKEQRIDVFNGNYDNYITQNANQTLTSVKLYSDQLNRLKEAKKKVEWGLAMRAKSKAWKIRYDHWLRDYEKMKAETVKPSFWIDQDSVEALDKKVVDSYHTFKQKNIQINVSTKTNHGSDLIQLRNVALGYEDRPILSNISFTVGGSDRIFIKGRNGAGKSTLVRSIVAISQNQEPPAKRFDGEISIVGDVRIGEYQQEISEKYLSLTLEDAIFLSYQENNVPITPQDIRKLLAQYLFDPTQDAGKQIMHLSGGQKARFQLIKMFIGQPNLLILDEPTNHLDLPSIEELENALADFQGGILYITHDTYFVKRMGGKVVEIGS